MAPMILMGLYLMGLYLTVCFHLVVGSGVNETTVSYSSHRDLTIPLTPDCELEILMGHQSKVVKTPFDISLEEPFYLDGGDVKISENEDFDLRTFCVGPDGRETESRVYYDYRTPNSAAVVQVCPLSLLLTLALALLMFH